MLDTIVYNQTAGNTLEKTVTHIEIIAADQIISEIIALSAQIVALREGEQTDETVLALANYQTQVAFLQGL